MRRLIVLLLALACASPPARAEPPLATDDARLVDKGKCQIEGLGRRQSGGGESDLALEFACNLTGNLELALGRGVLKSAADGETRITLLQGKTLFKSLEPDGVGYGLAFGVSRARPHDGQRFSEPFINLIGSLSVLDDRATLHANLGAVRDRREHLTRGTWGVAAEYSLGELLQLVAETTGQRGEKPTLQAGLRVHLVPDQLQVSVALGKQRSPASGRRFAALGFHFEF
ncbi:MAG: hypothetical protein ACREUO_00190 [Burkholderiales bacterium]